jgi:hypothetical protein
MKLSRRRALVLIGIIVVVFLTAACDSLRQLPTPAVPAATPAILTPLVTPGPATEQTAVAPTATATIQTTPQPTMTPGPSPTMDPITQVMVSQPARIGALQFSPDGRWRAEALIYDCVAVGGDPAAQKSFELLRVVDVVDGTEYQVDSQFINCGGLGAFGLDVLQWSADGRYLFYTPHREGQPDGGCGPWARTIVAVDTQEWTKTALDQAAASPDGAELAGWVDRELVIIALEGGERGRSPAPLPVEGLGPPVWSPDGARLAYVQTSTFCPAPTGESAVVLVDAATLQSQVVAASVAPEFAAVEWIDAGRLLVTDAAGSRWELDPATGVMTLLP